MYLRRILTLLCVTLPAGLAWAEPVQLGRCQCDSYVDECEGGVSYEKYWLTLTSNTQQCSDVTVSWGDQQHTFKVTDKTSRYPWLPGSADGMVVSSCKVCKDVAYDTQGTRLTYQPVKLADYGKDLQWLEGTWCWDWEGRPGMSHYKQVEGNTFLWGNQQHQIEVDGNKMISKATDKSYMIREILNRDTLRLLKHGIHQHEQEVSVVMWRCQ